MSPTDGEIRAALEPALGPISGLQRCPYEYASSYPLEAIDAMLADGAVVQLLFKDVRRSTPGSRATKVVPMSDPRREIAVYRHLLATRRLGTAALVAAVDEPELGRHWLFLERVAGRELYQVGDFAAWIAAARWLARLHAGWATETADCRLAQFDTHGQLAKLPRTVIHGEFYPSNVLIADSGRVCPVDWETAALGPGLIDVAALATGWGDGDRETLTSCYREELLLAGDDAPPLAEMLVQLDWCRLHLARRWLAALNHWQPPPHQTFDWRGEAERIAATLGIDLEKS